MPPRRAGPSRRDSRQRVSVALEIEEAPRGDRRPGLAAKITPARVQSELNRLFGVAADVAIPPSVSIRNALRDRLWQRAPAGEVAVP
jgi:hypothetical protein